MNYQELDVFEKAWIFKRKDPLVQVEDLAKIHPLLTLSANQVWRDYVSKEQLHPDHFNENDWLKQAEAKLGDANWEEVWDSDELELPEPIKQHLQNWQAETRVYFCYHSDHVVETTFSVFMRTWKNFLFFDNGPVLIARKKKLAVQFFSNGRCNLLQR